MTVKKLSTLFLVTGLLLCCAPQETKASSEWFSNLFSSKDEQAYDQQGTQQAAYPQQQMMMGQPQQIQPIYPQQQMMMPSTPMTAAIPTQTYPVQQQMRMGQVQQATSRLPTTKDFNIRLSNQIRLWLAVVEVVHA